MSFIAVTESRPKQDDDFGYELPNYKSFSVQRSSRNCERIKSYSLNYFKEEIVENFKGSTELCENLFLRTLVPKLGTLVVCTIYWSPKSYTSRVIDFMQNSPNYASHSKCVVINDSNIDTQKYDQQLYVRDSVDLMNSLWFVNQNTLPTYGKRTTGKTGSTIDFAWNNMIIKCRSYVSTPSIIESYAVSLVWDGTLND